MQYVIAKYYEINKHYLEGIAVLTTRKILSPDVGNTFE
jgi:hypothetical protein